MGFFKSLVPVLHCLLLLLECYFLVKEGSVPPLHYECYYSVLRPMLRFSDLLIEICIFNEKNGVATQN